MCPFAHACEKQQARKRVTIWTRLAENAGDELDPKLHKSDERDRWRERHSSRFRSRRTVGGFKTARCGSVIEVETERELVLSQDIGHANDLVVAHADGWWALPLKPALLTRMTPPMNLAEEDFEPSEGVAADITPSSHAVEVEMEVVAESSVSPRTRVDSMLSRCEGWCGLFGVAPGCFECVRVSTTVPVVSCVSLLRGFREY